jgi:hypothetical protein
VTFVSAVAAAILALLPVGDSTADRHAQAIVAAADSVELAAQLVVVDFRESTFHFNVERCRSHAGDGRGAFQLESGWGSLATRCGPLGAQAKRAAFALGADGCEDNDWCAFRRYAGSEKHRQEVAERNGLVWLTRRRIEARACVLP